MGLQAAAAAGNLGLVAAGGFWINRRCEWRHAETLRRLEGAIGERAEILHDLHAAITPGDMHDAAGAIRDAADTLSKMGRVE